MLRFPYLILLWTLAVTGCSGHLPPPPPAQTIIENKQFVIVTAGPNETLASLARTYLNDEGKAWKIAQYNRIDVLTQGKQVVIPKIPLYHGGIEPKGYQTVPVLLYSKVSNKPSSKKAVDAKTFDGQLKYLKENGHITVSLDQFNAFLALKDQLPPKAIVISFDTTQRWVYDIAFPMLRRRNMRAALFIRQTEIGSKGRLTWAQVAEMADNGIDIGVLGVNLESTEKQDLKQYLDKFEKELKAPKIAFKTHLKKPCRYFAYANSESDDYTIAALKKHGYSMAFTRKRGSSPFFINNYKIKRSIIYGHYDMAQFRRNLVTFKSAGLK